MPGLPACLPARSNVFTSFWMAGFESACHISMDGMRLDMIAATHHDRFVREDYARLKEFGITSVRDSVRWHLVEHAGSFEFSSMDAMLHAARDLGIQVVWDLCHYGWPDDLDVFAPAFVDRFARYCGAVARHVRDHGFTAPLYTPVNEISFLSWAAGQVGRFHPCARGRGTELKQQLVRACIAGMEAIWNVEPRARMVTVEPVIHVIPPLGQKDRNGEAAAYHASQYEAWDMLAGRLHPQLGGHPRYLDIMGVNFYHNNQWEHPGGRPIPWHIKPRDPRWKPFHRMLVEVYRRYHRPIFVGETSHVGVGRAEWIRELTGELCLAYDEGVPVEAACLYPIIDRFEWDDPHHWHNAGLWDFLHEPDGTLARVLNADYAEALRECQHRLACKLATLEGSHAKAG